MMQPFIYLRLLWRQACSVPYTLSPQAAGVCTCAIFVPNLPRAAAVKRLKKLGAPQRLRPLYPIGRDLMVCRSPSSVSATPIEGPGTQLGESFP